MTTQAREGPIRKRVYEIIFEADTPLGRLFDITLLCVIVASVLAVCLDSVVSIQQQYHTELIVAEWIFTVLFTIEFALRLFSVRRPLGYVFSFYGLVDVLAILPSYLSLILPGAQHLLVIRILRMLRIFRVLKLGRYVSESQMLIEAIKNSRPKIFVFLFTVLTLVVVIGAAMYLIEGPTHGFDSIPRAMYWAIVTLTTVGYGDITPQTVPGQILSSFLMIMGYGIIAIPTGIVTAELTSVTRGPITTRTCPSCMGEGHRSAASFCFACGEELRSAQR
ncbi:MAG: ion transporter [bacterium]|nr:ion transporter [bacterium]MCP5044666.1 ion transporter [bacterium]